MAVPGLDRLVVVSAAPVGPAEYHPGFHRAVVLPILEKVFGANYRDMRLMEAELAATGVSWVAARPPRLLTKASRGTYRSGPVPPKGGSAITIGDLATALADFAKRDAPQGAVYVANYHLVGRVPPSCLGRGRIQSHSAFRQALALADEIPPVPPSYG